MTLDTRTGSDSHTHTESENGKLNNKLLVILVLL